MNRRDVRHVINTYITYVPAVWEILAASFQIKIGIGFNKFTVHLTFDAFDWSVADVHGLVGRALETPRTIARAVEPETVPLKCRLGITCEERKC